MLYFVGSGDNRYLSTTIGQWYSGYQANYGFVVKYTTASENVQDYNALYTSNCSTVSVRPYIIVTYTGDLEQVLPNGTYYIVNVETGDFLDVESATNNAHTVTGPYTAQAKQKWVVTRTSGGYYTIYPATGSPILYLTVTGGNISSGARMTLCVDGGGYRTQFIISQDGYNGNYYRIGTRITNGSRYVTRISGSQIMQSDYTSSNSQTWVFFRVSDPVLLSMPYYQQEHSTWCWTAVAKMVADSVYHKNYTQTQIVTAVKGSGNLYEGGETPMMKRMQLTMLLQVQLTAIYHP